MRVLQVFAATKPVRFSLPANRSIPSRQIRDDREELAKSVKPVPWFQHGPDPEPFSFSRPHLHLSDMLIIAHHVGGAFPRRK
jgi:hypothetical protein